LFELLGGIQQRCRLNSMDRYVEEMEPSQRRRLSNCQLNGHDEGIVSSVCFKMSKQMKLETNQLTMLFVVVVKVKSTQSTFVLSI